MATPDKKPRPLYDEVAEWNRLLDYEENAALEGCFEGCKELAERRRLDKERQNLREAMPLTKANLGLWAQKLHDHLEEFSPNLFRDLKASDHLYEYCQEVANQAGEEFNDLLDTGLPYNQAFEIIKDQLYPPPEA